jgi:signal transduction histidine kinase
MNASRQVLHWPKWRPMLQQLHVRAALVAISLLVVLGTMMFFMLRHYNAQTSLEGAQRMNIGLARYIVEHQPPGLIGVDGKPDQARMKELAMHVMMINPSVEVYLLDNNGWVIAHALEGLQGPDPVGRQVDLDPVRKLLGNASEQTSRLPVIGTDPRNDSRSNIFSVAQISSGANVDGYLYVVLNGNAAQNVSASLSNSSTLRTTSVGLVVVIALAATVLLIALQKLTRPLRNLTNELKAFRGDTEHEDILESGDEITVLRFAAHNMEQRIARQFQQLEDGDRQRRELISNISHDLRTPLSSIQGYVETALLRGDHIDAETRATHLRTALRHVDLLGKRIGDLFELSKLDAGRVEPKQEVFCLAELLQDVVQNYQLTAQQRNVKLSLAISSHMKAKVLADIAMIERVLQNLIDNALRYTAAGGEVTLAIQMKGAHMEISVTDTGCGIAQEHLPHIFERYWRVTDAAVTESGTSSGLGLAIVKRMLDLHGSVVRVSSEFKRGTRFEFMLPQAT